MLQDPLCVCCVMYDKSKDHSANTVSGHPNLKMSFSSFREKHITFDRHAEEKERVIDSTMMFSHFIPHPTVTVPQKRGE